MGNTQSAPRRGPAIFLQAVIVLAGAGALAFLLWEPHVEGRNVGATLFEIYFKDPFLAYAYLASVPFFAGLYQGFKVLAYIGRDEALSPATVGALRRIRSCALALIGFVALGELFILWDSSDDRAGGVFMGLLVASGSAVAAAAAAVFEGVLRKAAGAGSAAPR